MGVSDGARGAILEFVGRQCMLINNPGHSITVVESPRVVVRDFGPFREAEVEVKPLTIFIGRNSTGKSMLARLMWALTVAAPDSDVLDALIRQNDELVKRVVEGVRDGWAPIDELRELVRRFIERLPEALARGLATVLKDTFQEELSGLVRVGGDRAWVGVYGPRSSIEFQIEGGSVTVVSHRPYLQFLDTLEREVDVRDGRLFYCNRGFIIRSPGDVTKAVMCMLASYILEGFKVFFLTEDLSAFLVDSRAGITRALLKPYLPPSVLRQIAYSDDQFIRTYFKLAEKLSEGEVELGLAEDFMEELGYRPIPTFEHGIYTLRLRMWTGNEIPLSRAPSGVRESLALALALTAKGEPYMVFVEEPESHLHPRAQDLLARVIARAVNKLGKWVVITTHSDYLLYAISDLIAVRSRGPEKLGFSQDEALDFNAVALYLVRPDGDRAVVERLETSENGIYEEELAAVAEEVANRRAKIMELSRTQ